MCAQKEYLHGVGIAKVCGGVWGCGGVGVWVWGVCVSLLNNNSFSYCACLTCVHVRTCICVAYLACVFSWSQPASNLVMSQASSLLSIIT